MHANDVPPSKYREAVIIIIILFGTSIVKMSVSIRVLKFSLANSNPIQNGILIY